MQEPTMPQEFGIQKSQVILVAKRNWGEGGVSTRAFIRAFAKCCKDSTTVA